MITMRMQLPCTFFIITLLCAPSLHSFRTLSTQSRWIVDVNTSQRVKLACGNWVGHMEPMIPEGLNKQPIDKIAIKMASLFNCVRLTWATYMYTRSSTLKVEESLMSLNLSTAIDGIREHNPNILGMTIVNAQAAVVEALGKHGIMVILDNHVSKPQWCCSGDDGNAWFGDKFFDPNEWVKGLELVATRYKGNRKVVGMSLRNEPRGSHQDLQVWHNYMQQGADTVHNANPDVLVIVSGTNYDQDLSFVRNPALAITVPKKLVYEVHRYSFTSNTEAWINDPLNQVCARFIKRFDDSAGYLIDSGRDSVPLLVSEFGVDQRGINEGDNKFLPCMLSLLADKDLDWALWAFHGSYYVRSGEVGMEEMYGVLDDTWAHFRNKNFTSLFQLLLKRIQDPLSESAKYYVLYHPLSGNCLRIGRFHKIKIGKCKGRSRWTYDARDGRFRLLGKYNRCLKVVKEGEPITISKNCSSTDSNWSILSDSMMQMGVKDEQGTQLCMEADPLSESAKYYVLYHPLSGNCLRIGRFHKIKIGKCKGRSRWTYDARDGRFRLLGKYNRCLKVVKEGEPITISKNCSSTDSNWSILSDSMMQMGVKDEQGTQLCMEAGESDHFVYSKKCICVDGNDKNCREDPMNQWFKLVLSNV